jgi:hypothetical protein
MKRYLATPHALQSEPPEPIPAVSVVVLLLIGSCVGLLVACPMILYYLSKGLVS